MSALVRRTNFRNVGLIHGYMHVTGKPALDDLSRSCKSIGMDVHYPELPDKSTRPRLPAWLEALNRTITVIEKTTAVVGLSMGSPTALHLIAQEHVKEVGLLVLIAPVTPIVVSSALPFLAHFFDGLNNAIRQVAQKTRRIEILTSDNDPWAQLPVTTRLAEQLHANLHLIYDGGHLDSDAGFTKFPYVLDMIAPGEISITRHVDEVQSILEPRTKDVGMNDMDRIQVNAGEETQIIGTSGLGGCLALAVLVEDNNGTRKCELGHYSPAYLITEFEKSKSAPVIGELINSTVLTSKDGLTKKAAIVMSVDPDGRQARFVEYFKAKLASLLACDDVIVVKYDSQAPENLDIKLPNSSGPNPSFSTAKMQNVEINW